MIATEHINASSKDTELNLVAVTVLWFPDAVLDITAFIFESILFIKNLGTANTICSITSNNSLVIIDELTKPVVGLR